MATASAKKSIILVDDHPVVRFGLRSLIEMEDDLEVVADVPGVESALTALQEPVDLAVIDISLPDGNGLDLIRRLGAMHPDLKLLVASMYDEGVYAERVIRLGAHGYVCKRDAANTIVHAIRQILAGNIYLSEQAGQVILNRLIRDDSSERSASDVDRLTTRELEVFQLIAEGQGVRDIAAHLHISHKTVESYRERIKLKLNIKNAPQLVRFAHDWARNQGA